MVQFSPELCNKLCKQTLRNVTVQNTNTENIQCSNAKYFSIILIYIHNAMSLSLNIFPYIFIQYIDIISHILQLNMLYYFKKIWSRCSTPCTVNHLSMSQCCPLFPHQTTCQCLSAALYCPTKPPVNVSVLPSIAHQKTCQCVSAALYCPPNILSMSQCCPLLLTKKPVNVSVLPSIAHQTSCQCLSAALYCPTKNLSMSQCCPL